MKKNILLLIALLCMGIGMAGCGKKEDKKNPITVNFKDITVEEVQQLVQGKWEVIRLYGGFTGRTEKITDTYYIEFIGDSIWRETRQNLTADYPIAKWEKIKSPMYGSEVVVLTMNGSEKPSTKLDGIFNDTLVYGTFEIYDGFGYGAIRVRK